MESTYNAKAKAWEIISHRFCGTTAHIGMQNGKIFRYCPRCEVLLEKRNEKDPA